MLTEKEFLVLKTIKCSNRAITQRRLSEIIGCSLGTVNKILNTFLDRSYITAEYTLTTEGTAELEAYRVRNAVILAAGMTSDTNPIAKNIPKGLYIVNGEVLIERLIRQLQEAGIREIYVVAGFRMEQFFYLEEKYNVTIIPNIQYMSRSNNASVYCVKEKLGNSYIIPNDEYFTENVFSEYEYESYYASMFYEGKTKEAFMKLDRNNRILEVYKGGNSGWVMLGHAYLDRAFSEKYVRWLEDAYDLSETRKKYWEEIFYPHLKEECLYARKYPGGVIYEFDELSELQGFDNQFINNISPDIYRLISRIFNSSMREITDVQPCQGEDIDITFRFKVRNDAFVFRYPSRISADIIRYSAGAAINQAAKELGVDDSFVYEDRSGNKISLMTQQCSDLTAEKACELVQKLHSGHHAIAYSFDYREKIRDIYELFDSNQLMRASDFQSLKETTEKLLGLIEKDGWEKKLCHNHISREKFADSEFHLSLTDWRFAGINDIGYDISAVAAMFSETGELDREVVSRFMEPTYETVRHLTACQAVASFYRLLLGIYYSDASNEFSDHIYENWKCAELFSARAEKLYAERKNQYLSNDQVAYVEMKIGERFVSLTPLTGGVTNTTYEMRTESGKHYALRVPGKGTNAYINRTDEMANILALDSLGIMPRVICADPDTGVLIMDYIENSTACSVEDVYDPAVLKQICRVLHMVHQSGAKFKAEFDIPAEQNRYRIHLKTLGGSSPEELAKEEKRLDGWMEYLFQKYPKELTACHIDPKLNNFLKKGKQLYLIDWEYSDLADAYFDLANLTLTNNLTAVEEKLFLDSFCRVSGIQFIREKYLLYKFATDYLWVYWHLIKCRQNSMVEYNEMSWRKRFKRAKETIALIEKETKH